MYGVRLRSRLRGSTDCSLDRAPYVGLPPPGVFPGVGSRRGRPSITVEGDRDRMIRRHFMLLRLALMIADGSSAAIVFALVTVVRFGDVDMVALWARMGVDVRLAALAFGIAWVAALRFMGLYRLRARWRLMTEARDIAKATLLVAVVTLSFLFVVDRDDISRLFLALLFATQPLVTLAGRTTLRIAFSCAPAARPQRALHAHRGDRLPRSGVRGSGRVAREPRTARPRSPRRPRRRRAAGDPPRRRHDRRHRGGVPHARRR